MKMPSVRTVKLIGETRLCYLSEYDGVGYSLCVTASPAFVEKVFVPDVTRSFDTAKRLCELLSENLVFPGNVLEILDDLLASDFFG